MADRRGQARREKKLFKELRVSAQRGNVEGPDRPVFVVGAGRSGSTVFFDVLAHHPGVAWLSRLCDRFPDRAGLNRLILRAVDLRPVGSLVHAIAYPGEVYRFWGHHARGFPEPFRDLRADDVTTRQRRRLRQRFIDMTTPTRRRLLVKITGWPRLGYLNEVFPDALFVHVVRDGRAVASSLLQTSWWRGWGGPSRWRFGELSPSFRAEWEQHDRSFVALAAIQWKLLMDAFEVGRSGISDERFLQVRYEDLCTRPEAEFRRCLEFCQLPWVGRFERRVRSTPFVSTNNKWKQVLTLHQQSTLEAVLRTHLHRYGFL